MPRPRCVLVSVVPPQATCDGERRTTEPAGNLETPPPGGSGKEPPGGGAGADSARKNPFALTCLSVKSLGREACCPYDFHRDLSASPCLANETSALATCRVPGMGPHDFPGAASFSASAIGSPSGCTSSFFRKPTYGLRKTDTYREGA